MSEGRDDVPSQPHSADDHPNVEEICDLDEGLLTFHRAASVRAHLESCADCAEILTALEDVPEVLRIAASEEIPVPDGVVERIDSALAAEVTRMAEAALATSVQDESTTIQDTTTTATNSPPDLVVVSRETTTGRSLQRSPQGTAEAASQNGAESAQPPHPDGEPGKSRRSGRSGRMGPRSSTSRPRGFRTRRLLLTTAATVAVVALGGGVFGALHTGTTDDNDAPARDAATGPEYSKQQLSAQVHHLLAEQQQRQQRRSKPARTDAPSNRAAPRQTAPQKSRDSAARPLTSPSSPHSASASRPVPGKSDAPRCARKATGQGTRQPLATDRGEYRGTDVAVFVFPSRARQNRVQVYLVDPHCSDAPGKVLLRKQVRR